MPNEPEPSRFDVRLEQFHLKDLVLENFAQDRVTEFVDRRAQPARPQNAFPSESTGQSRLDQSFKEVDQDCKNDERDNQHQQQPKRLTDDFEEPAQWLGAEDDCWQW